MPNLQATADEVLGIFPIKLPKLDVVTPTNKPEQVEMIYVQRDTKDSRRNWPAYRAWLVEQGKYDASQLAEGDISVYPIFPPGIDRIYYECYGHIRNGLVGTLDKIVLAVELRQDKGLPTDSVVWLDRIRRNKDSSLRGIGALFYENLRSWLRQRDFKILLTIPLFGKESYWGARGQVLDTSLPEEKRSLISNQDMEPERKYVDILK